MGLLGIVGEMELKKPFGEYVGNCLKSRNWSDINQLWICQGLPMRIVADSHNYYSSERHHSQARKRGTRFDTVWHYIS